MASIGRLRSPVWAAALSLLLPGLGQFVAGRRRRGVLWATPVVVGILATAFAVGTSSSTDLLADLAQSQVLLALTAVNGGLLVYRLAAMADAWLVVRSLNPARARSVARWPSMALAAILLASLALHGATGWVTLRASQTMESIFVAVGPGGMAIPEPGFTDPPPAAAVPPVAMASAEPSVNPTAPAPLSPTEAPPSTATSTAITSPGPSATGPAGTPTASNAPSPSPTSSVTPGSTPTNGSPSPSGSGSSQAPPSTAAPTTAPATAAHRTPAPTRAPAPAPTPVPGWAADGRLNLLLVGSDAGPDRISLRTDTMILLSVDIRSGRAALFGIPRNLVGVPVAPEDQAAVPDGRFPDLLNALFTFAMAHPEEFPGGDFRGFRAVAGAVQELVGVRLDGMAVVNLAGFVRLVDSLGGLWIDVPYQLIDTFYPLEDGSGHISVEFDPGCQHLDGRLSLAFARSRQQDSDYGRMHRQQLVLLALRHQLNPLALVPKIPDLLDAAGSTVWTTLSPTDLKGLLRLASHVQTDRTQSMFFTPPAYAEHLDDAEIARIQAVVRGVFQSPAPPSSTFATPNCP